MAGLTEGSDEAGGSPRTEAPAASLSRRLCRWGPMVGWLAIFLLAATVESWPFTFQSRFWSVLCTLPLNVLLPLGYLAGRIYLAGNSRLSALPGILLRLRVTLIAVLLLVAQWTWMLTIRIPLNERSLALQYRACLWGPTRQAYLMLAAYRRKHAGAWPRTIRQFVVRPPIPGLRQDTMAVSPSGLHVSGSAAILEINRERVRIIYTGAGLPAGDAANVQFPVLISSVGAGAAGFVACMADGHLFWISGSSEETVLRLWNYFRRRGGIAPIQFIHGK